MKDNLLAAESRRKSQRSQIMMDNRQASMDAIKWRRKKKSGGGKSCSVIQLCLLTLTTGTLDSFNTENTG